MEETFQFKEWPEVSAKVVDEMNQVLAKGSYKMEVRNITVRRGSIEFWVTIGTIYYVVSNYKQFVEGIELMVRQLRDIVYRLVSLREPTVRVTYSWYNGPALEEIRARGSEATGLSREDLPMVYLIISHAALLFTLLWILLTRVA
jgi:hypothetical protein